MAFERAWKENTMRMETWPGRIRKDPVEDVIISRYGVKKDPEGDMYSGGGEEGAITPG